MAGGNPLTDIRMQKNTTIPISYWSFITKDKNNRRRLLIILACALIEFFLFKLLYPFPSFFSDSYSYIFAAAYHLDVNVWPIGYSKFLEYFPWLTRNHLSLVIFQYGFLLFSSVVFFFT